MNEELEQEESEPNESSTPPSEEELKMAQALVRLQAEKAGGTLIDASAQDLEALARVKAREEAEGRGGSLLDGAELLATDYSKLSPADFLEDLRQGGHKILAAPESLRDNAKFMLDAFKTSHKVLSVLGPTLKKSEHFFLEIAEIAGAGVEYGDPAIQENQKIIALAAQNYPQILARTPLRNDFNFVRELAAKNPGVLPYAPPEIVQKLKGAG